MTSKEIVKRAVTFADPERLPILFFNRDVDKSDIHTTGYGTPKDFIRDVPGRDEWGYRFHSVDQTMGQVLDHPLEVDSAFSSYVWPDALAKGRFEHVDDFMAAHADSYLMASLGISGFNKITFLRGFENTLTDIIMRNLQLDMLLHRMFGFENALIEQFANWRFDAVAFGDDWGTQNSLMISPKLWREVFKPWYAEQFKLVHNLGMDVYFHSCGYIYEIMGDLIEIGVDIFNLNQPDLLGIERLGSEFSGKVTFCCPVDHQTTAVQGTRAELFAYVDKLYKYLHNGHGGFIGYIEDYPGLGMSDSNYAAIVEAFEGITFA